MTFNAPLLDRSVPSWMLHKFARFEAQADITYKYGFNWSKDSGVTGFAFDGGSLEMVKSDINPLRAIGDESLDALTVSTYGRRFTQGFRLETGEFDIKFQINYTRSHIPGLSSSSKCNF